ncbi:hypothetical protein HL670_03037 [Serratia plymuthica]|uniref:Membrane protein n=1 Tax=Serratia plymuthica S13 TaxID=1348660 RepID=S4YQK3_SERPL|nr:MULTISPECIES: hypothetical protein [Serratia]AEF45111.1 hypothetical protein SerAS9_1985 [Serratia plymuthica AS9]AEF50062.1 hypothetical protein SerAS12_1985 [Serratia sp. AS12]AEG27769.1 hypothetical protein SerAS13_1986 [Serratia sp. AS13]AGP46969.1 membrane protein [Serratia plymuthica S13]ANJ91563.1 membrane protein [Serratia plymuthica]
MLILYATLAIIFTLLFLLSFIYCAYQMSKDGDVKFKASFAVLILSLLAFYCAYGYVSTYLKQQEVDIKLY